MKRFIRSSVLGTVAAVFAAIPLSAGAAEKVGAIDSTKGPFDHYALHQAKDEGYFKAEGLDVDIIYGSGGAATLQTLLTGSRDIAIGVGVLSVIGAYAKGAPVKILGNVFKGVGNVLWYVRADSPIKSFKDLDGGKDLVYSRAGSTSNLAVLMIAEALHIHPKFVSVGGMASSRTQVMSGQVDTGWLAAPFNLDLIRTGKARVIGSGKSAGDLANWTVRVVAANSEWLAKHRDTAKKFMRALAKGREFNYTEKGVERYAKAWHLDMRDAKRAPEFVPREVTVYNKIFGFDKLIKAAYDLKYIKKPLPMSKAKGMLDLIGAEGS